MIFNIILLISILVTERPKVLGRQNCAKLRFLEDIFIAKYPNGQSIVQRTVNKTFTRFTERKNVHNRPRNRRISTDLETTAELIKHVKGSPGKSLKKFLNKQVYRGVLLVAISFSVIFLNIKFI